jgi:hypothetical protein
VSTTEAFPVLWECSLDFLHGFGLLAQIIHCHLLMARSFFVFGSIGLNSWVCPCQAGALPLEPHLQPFMLQFIFQIGSCVLPGIGI